MTKSIEVAEQLIGTVMFVQCLQHLLRETCYSSRDAFQSISNNTPRRAAILAKNKKI